jgi:hypothetical protein
MDIRVALAPLSEDAMQSRARQISPGQCAYCGEQLAFNKFGIDAWRVGDQFVCNEFCADGIPDKLATSQAEAPSVGPQLSSRFDRTAFDFPKS